MSLLERIIDAKRREVEDMSDGHGRAETLGPTRTAIDVVSVLRRPERAPLRLIAEVKLRSPSAGPLSRALSPADRAVAYAEAGAAMVSVLCDTEFFDGSWDHLRLARQALEGAARLQGPSGARLPLLAKEFVIDRRQVGRARDAGADALLLIARIVSRSRLADLARACRDEGLEPFVEVVDEIEVDAALEAGARVVGVNARDLDTLRMDPDRTARVLRAIPPAIVAVHLSGLRVPDDVSAAARGRPDAALIGEALMRDDDPRPRLRSFVAAATNAVA